MTEQQIRGELGKSSGMELRMAMVETSLRGLSGHIEVAMQLINKMVGSEYPKDTFKEVNKAIALINKSKEEIIDSTVKLSQNRKI